MPARPSPRLIALDGLSQIIGEGRMLSDVTGDAAWAELQPAERATAQRLIVETLRYVGRADHILAPFLQRQPPLRVTNLLRMATVELMSGGAAHGVVNDAVQISGRSKRTAPMKGLVNAVLRKVSALPDTAWSEAPNTKLPRWLRSKLLKAWGKNATAALEAAHAVAPSVDLTVKSDPERWAKELEGTALPTGSVRLQTPGQVSSLAGYDTGDWWVQDAAAALPAKLLGDVAGKTVLDICAAPGGKTMQLAAMGAKVTALDVSEKRMARLESNLKRTNLTASCVVADAFEYSESGFDAVLLDAPCSATGTIRRHPDLLYVKSQTGLKDLVALQRKFLLHALQLLKPGGRLVYCTCSLLPEEGEEQIAWLLGQSSGVELVETEFAWIDPKWRSVEGGLRLRPDYWAGNGGMDGFYMALLRQNGTAAPR